MRAVTSESGSEEDTSSDCHASPPVADPTTLQEQVDAIIQQEQDDLSPSTVPVQEETEARSGYTASLSRLPNGLLFSVLRASDRLVSLAAQLVDNQTSNLDECYMGLRTQCDGGKAFNQVQSGSFEGRCYAAGFKFQEGAKWITDTYEGMTGQQPPQPLVDITYRTEQRARHDGK